MAIMPMKATSLLELAYISTLFSPLSLFVSEDSDKASDKYHLEESAARAFLTLNNVKRNMPRKKYNNADKKRIWRDIWNMFTYFPLLLEQKQVLQGEKLKVLLPEQNRKNS